ncbi:MAG: glycosyltransferase family 4 protein [Bradymonadaceae bacterium]|nr:glycosyltransferase family 4 protein [Lujinxingiaceae bacterium]
MFGISTTGKNREGRAVVDATALDTGHRDRGIGRYVSGLLGGFEELARLGELDVDLAALRLVQDASKPALPGTGQLEQWSLHRPKTTHLTRFALNEALLSGEVQSTGARLYHATEPWAAPIGRGFRTVLTCHDIIPLLYPAQYMGRGHLYWRAYYTWMQLQRRWTRLDRIIAISEATRHTIVERLGVPDSRVRVVHNGIDHTQFKPVHNIEHLDDVRRRLNLPGVFALYIGGFDYRKNINTLIACLARFQGVDLVLAGSIDEATRQSLQAVAREHGVLERVRWLGFVDDQDLAALYALAMCFVYPSLAEGFGLQALEAMALGCPVIASNTSSLPEVVGKAGLLVDPTSAQEIGAGVARLATDELLRAKLSADGLARAKEFSWQRCARETLAVYREVLSEGD